MMAMPCLKEGFYCNQRMRCSVLLAVSVVFAATSFVAESATSNPGGNSFIDVSLQGLSECHLSRCPRSLREITS